MEKEVCPNCARLQKRIEELERRLLAYENAHTPPSQRRFLKRKQSSNGKIGAPLGHKGATRETKRGIFYPLQFSKTFKE